MALWSAKKEASEEPLKIDVPGAAGSGASGPLEELTSQLGKLGQLLDRTNEQVVAYLVHRESQAAAGGDDDAVGQLTERIDSLAEKLDQLVATGPSRDAPAEPPAAKAPDERAADEQALASAVRPLQEKLDQLDAKLSSIGGAAAPPDASLTAAVGHLGNEIHQHTQTVAGTVAQLQQRLDAGFQYVLEQLRPPEPDQSDAGPTSSAEWQRIVLGAQLAEHPGLDFQRQQLLGGLVDGDPGACSLIGQLLVFRSTTSEKRPALLKEIGEAYYRWQPKAAGGSNPMETALVGWLKETMQEAGISNTIELVHPGERFDSTRHTAASRGVEIAEVRGWIVLRDNGKVYTKANVAVR